jgi:hypothetical protein
MRVADIIITIIHNLRICPYVGFIYFPLFTFSFFRYQKRRDTNIPALFEENRE